MDEANAIGDMGTDGGWVFIVRHSHILARLFVGALNLALVLGEALAGQKACKKKQA